MFATQPSVVSLDFIMPIITATFLQHHPFSEVLLKGISLSLSLLSKGNLVGKH